MTFTMTVWVRDGRAYIGGHKVPDEFLKIIEDSLGQKVHQAKYRLERAQTQLEQFRALVKQS